jgi:hypothetical protein
VISTNIGYQFGHCDACSVGTTILSRCHGSYRGNCCIGSEKTTTSTCGRLFWWFYVAMVSIIWFNCFCQFSTRLDTYSHTVCNEYGHLKPADLQIINRVKIANFKKFHVRSNCSTLKGLWTLRFKSLKT